jgi:hypothetical protein
MSVVTRKSSRESRGEERRGLSQEEEGDRDLSRERECVYGDRKGEHRGDHTKQTGRTS